MSCANCEATINDENAGLTIVYKGKPIGSVCKSCTPEEQRVVQVMLSILFPPGEMPRLEQYQYRPKGF